MSMKLRAALAAAIVAAGSFGWATIAQAGQPANESSDPPSSAVEAVKSCRGGAQEFVQVVTNDTPVTRGEGALADLAGGGGAIGQAVPAGDTDLFVVSFSSESRLIGAGPSDRMEVRATINGVPIDPLGPNTFVEGTTNGVQNSATWCARVGAGNHVVRVQWSVTDIGNNNVVTGQVDDTALHLEVSN